MPIVTDKVTGETYRACGSLDDRRRRCGNRVTTGFVCDSCRQKLESTLAYFKRPGRSTAQPGPNPDKPIVGSRGTIKRRKDNSGSKRPPPCKNPQCDNPRTYGSVFCWECEDKIDSEDTVL